MFLRWSGTGDQLGIDVTDALEANLREEQAALDELSEIGEEFDCGQISRLRPETTPRNPTFRAAPVRPPGR